MWSECTKDCGGGRQYRTRWCVDPHPQGKGKECSEQKELGPAIKSRSCNEHVCSEGTKHSPTRPLLYKAHSFHEWTPTIDSLYTYTNMASFIAASGRDLQAFEPNEHGFPAS